MWGSPASFGSNDPSKRQPARANKTSRSMEITVKNLDEDAGVKRSQSSFSMDSLLRLFRSDFFDAFMAVTYLYRYRDTTGVNDYLCNELYQLSDADLEAFMPQLCNLLVHHAHNSPGLERFVMDKCSSSMHFALQVFWFLQAAVEDAVTEGNAKAEARCRLLRTECETAAVNGSQHAIKTALASNAASGEEIPSAVMDRLQNGNLLLAPITNPGNMFTSLGESADKSSQSFQFEGVPIMCSDELSALESNDMEGAHVDDCSSDDSSPDVSPDVALAPFADDASTSSESDSAMPDNLGPTAAKASVNGVHKPASEEDSKQANDSAFSKELPDGSPAANCEAAKVDGDVNSKSVDLMDASVSEPVSDSTANGKDTPVKDASTLRKQKSKPPPLAALPSGSTDRSSSSTRAEEKSAVKKLRTDPAALMSLDMDPMTLVRMKQERFDYFTDSLAITKSFVQLSFSTREIPQGERQDHLTRGLRIVNEMLLRRMSGESAIPLVVGTPAPPAREVAKMGLNAALRSIHLPLTRANSQVLRILRVHEKESIILTSRTRAPYMLFIEVLPTPMTCSDRLLFCEHIAVAHSPDPQQGKRKSDSFKTWNMSTRERDIAATPKPETPKRNRKLSELTPQERQRANVRTTIYGDAYSDQPYEFSLADEEEKPNVHSAAYKSRQAALLAVFGELWSWKEERILKNSPFVGMSQTRLMSFIVKAGDDLRQEQLAIQLISQFDVIFKEENVDVFLRPFTVMSVSSDAGLVEVMPDSVSVHSLKARTPNFSSLLDYFERAYGDKDTQSFRAAQRRFIRSMAGYSLVTYFLQIKDRHNGNIMLDALGHVVHIDFGFMLTNSPGAIKFENAPFKLTEEYLQVICAMKNVSDINKISKTEGFRYFQELFVLGLLAARKHYEKITTLVRIMMEGTRMPCMAAGQSVIDSLEHRFMLKLSEHRCINHAISLIESSRQSWRSIGYDQFQNWQNGYQ